MDDYLLNYNTYNNIIVFIFEVGDGGIGDLIKYFIRQLQICIESKIKIKYLVTNNPINNYLRLKYSQFYITQDELINNKNNNITICRPSTLYSNHSVIYKNLVIPGSAIFYFTDVIINRANKFIKTMPLPYNKKYISIHLRLGDKYIETDPNFKAVPNDERKFSEERICKCIEDIDNNGQAILFLCDNKKYSLELEARYPVITVPNYDIGHTSYVNTTDNQIVNTLTEFYLLAHSENIYAASESGFSIVAAKFNNIPLINLY